MLNNKVKKNNAKLVIAIYPCLADYCEENKFQVINFNSSFFLRMCLA